MLLYKEIEELFHYLPGDLLDEIQEIRAIVARITPEAAEVVHSKGLSYFHADRGGPVSGGICQIVIQTDHIDLAFNHGAFIPDPHHLLRGSGKAKRHVPIESFDRAPWLLLEELIEVHSRFDPYTQSFRPPRQRYS